MRRQRVARIHHPVGQPHLVAAQIGLDPALQMQDLAEQRCLHHRPLGPEDAALAFPPLAIAGQPRGDGADPAMQPVAHRGAARIVVVPRRHLFGAKRVIQPAGRQKPRERPHPAQTLLAPLELTVGGAADPAGKTLYASLDGGQTIVSVDTESLSKIRTRPEEYITGAITAAPAPEIAVMIFEGTAPAE